MSDKQLTDAIKYFLRHLEKQAERIEAEKRAHQPETPVQIDEIEHFFRTLKTQNIFIFVVGVNGKPESSALPKIVFSLSKVVRIYYSLSLDTNQAGFIRIHADQKENLIVIERLHGYHPKPERLYASKNPCHIIRFITRWILRRIDWEKTKLKNLELYKKYRAWQDEQEAKRQLEEEEAVASLRLKDILDKTPEEAKTKKKAPKKQAERRKP